MKRLPKCFLLCCCLALAPLPRIAADEQSTSQSRETPIELDVETAVELALARNLGIRSQRIELLIAKRDFAHRFNVFMPDISARGTLTRPNSEPTDPTAGTYKLVEPLYEFHGFPLPEAEDPPRWNLSGEISAQLTVAPKMIHAVRAVTEDYRNEQIEMEDAKREIEHEVRKAFYELLLEQKQLKLAKQRLNAAEERYQEIRDNYDAGLADELTLRRTQVEVETQRPTILQQRQTLETAERSLAATIGLDSPADFELVGSIQTAGRELADEEQLLNYVGENADVRSAQRQRQSLEINTDLTRSDMFPSLTMGYSLNPQLSGDPLSSDAFDPDLYSDNGSFSLTLSQPIDPLLPGSSTRQKLANERDQQRQIDLQIQQARNSVEQKTHQLAGAITAAEETIESMESNVDLAEQAFELAQEAYENGVRDYSVVRDAEIDLADARLQLLKQQHSYVELLLDLEYLLNTPMEEMKENQ